MKSRRKEAAFLKAVPTNNASASFKSNKEIIPQGIMPKPTSASIAQNARRTMETSVGDCVPSPQSKYASYDPSHNPTEINRCILGELDTKGKRDADSEPLLRDEPALPSQTSGWQSLTLAAVNVACSMLTSILFPWACIFETVHQALLPLFSLR